MALKMPMLDLSRRVVEPKKRLREGSFGWVVHRFPIKEGITLRDMMMRSLAEPSSLLRLIERHHD